MLENRPQDKDRASFENEKEEFSDISKTPQQVTEDISKIVDNKMPKNQLMLVIFLGTLGLAVLVLGIVQMKSNLILPWPDSLTGQEQSPIELLDDQASAEELKNKDTDTDGLSDYDELYVYSTSPYLADSDSDGSTDKQEIDSLTDPNCPTGQICFGFTEEETTTPDSTVTTTYKPTATELRTLLLQSGDLTQDQIDQFSDEELMVVYDEMIKENPDLQTQVDTGVQELAKVYTLSAEEIRQLLRDQGVDEETLSVLTDEDLQAIYQEALDEASGNIN